MNEEISNSTAIALAASVTIGILAILSLLLAAAGRCEIEAVTRCGIQKCHFRAVVDCAGLEELLKKQPEAIP